MTRKKSSFIHHLLEIMIYSTEKKIKWSSNFDRFDPIDRIDQKLNYAIIKFNIINIYNFLKK